MLDVSVSNMWPQMSNRYYIWQVNASLRIHRKNFWTQYWANFLLILFFCVSNLGSILKWSIFKLQLSSWHTKLWTILQISIILTTFHVIGRISLIRKWKNVAFVWKSNARKFIVFYYFSMNICLWIYRIT